MILNLLIAVLALPLVSFVAYVGVLRCASALGCGLGNRLFSSSASSSAAIAQVPMRLSVVIVSRRLDMRLMKKLRSLEHLEASPLIHEVLVGIDGEHGTEVDRSCRQQLAELQRRLRVKVRSHGEHVGKNQLLNTLLSEAAGTHYLFSDVDATLCADALVRLERWFSDPAVGGVVGQRVIHDSSNFAQAQASYVDFDSRLRALETRVLGSTTSCDGKLYAVDAALVDTVPLHVTDDAYVGLGVPLRYRRLVFDASIRANIARPAKNPAHELARRRRVTTRGLHTLVERKMLFNPKHYGVYACALAANKLCRRFAPLSALLTVIAIALVFSWKIALSILAGVACILLFAVWHLNQFGISGASGATVPVKNTRLKRKMASWLYFVLGMAAMSLGVFDFLRGRRITKWEPKKAYEVSDV